MTIDIEFNFKMRPVEILELAGRQCKHGLTPAFFHLYARRSPEVPTGLSPKPLSDRVQSKQELKSKVKSFQGRAVKLGTALRALILAYKSAFTSAVFSVCERNPGAFCECVL